jgi:citrate lyase subunit beta/citryl-CoA lyase
MLARARSFLFVPATNLARVDKALASQADAVIVDLEDAVPEAEKESARGALADHLTRAARRARGLQLVRVNGLRTTHGPADLAAVAGMPLDGIVVPKAEPADLEALPGDAPPAVAIIETAGGLRSAYQVARHPGVQALLLGTVDLSLDLGARPDEDVDALLFAASSVVVDSAAAGLGSPIDGVCTAVGDEDALRREALRARALGYGSKACIHPSQLAVVHEVFTPSPDEVEQARRLLEAYDAAVLDGRGAIAVDGQMVDEPIAARARRLLARSDVTWETDT